MEQPWWCSDCLRALPLIRPPCCELCSQPFEGSADPSFICPNCHGKPFHFSHAIAAVSSRGAIRELVHGLKYRRQAWAARPLAEIAAGALADPRLRHDSPEVLVPVPLHPLRQRERGFNQSELLAREIGRLSGLPVQGLLRRIRATTTQTHFDRRTRMRNLRGAIALRHNAAVKPLSILLVDDVLTTGSTLDECARVLLEAGYPQPAALAVARG
ncbi:MAG: ComF family protein [Terrimicrobiaceae bacterium]